MYRVLFVAASFVVAMVSSGCPSGNECDQNFNTRCEGNTAVNCRQHCGFGPCDNEVRRDDCNQSCQVVNAEDEADNAPINVATDQIAACSNWESADDGNDDAGADASASGDAGSTTDAGPGDADTN